MIKSRKDRCLVLAELDMFIKIESVLNGQFNLVRIGNVEGAITISRKYSISCIIAHINGCYETTPQRLMCIPAKTASDSGGKFTT